MRRYVLTSAALGLISVWASENLFWTAPPEGWSPLELLLTWVAYSLCAASALSAVLVTGVQGWRAAFLGGAVLGWLVEGVVVGTMYAAFPFQVVWTPLAWHALVTGVLVLGVGRASVRWPWPRQLAAWVGVGLLAGVFGLFWPLERDTLPGPLTVGAYLVGLGLVVPFAQLALDRIGRLETPSRRVLAVAPGLLALLWLVQVAFAPSPIWLTLPLLLWGVWWVMRRLGAATRGGLDLGAPASLRRHLLFLAAPVTTTAVVSAGWRLAPDGLEGNLVALVLTAPTSLVLLARLAAQARRSVRSPGSGTA